MSASRILVIMAFLLLTLGPALLLSDFGARNGLVAISPEVTAPQTAEVP